MKKLLAGLALGILISSAVYALEFKMNHDSIVVDGNLKFEGLQIQGDRAQGRMLVKIGGKWYQFENQPYVKLTK